MPHVFDILVGGSLRSGEDPVQPERRLRKIADLAHLQLSPAQALLERSHAPPERVVFAALGEQHLQQLAPRQLFQVLILRHRSLRDPVSVRISARLRKKSPREACVRRPKPLNCP